MTRGPARDKRGIAQSIAIFVIRLYQILISPFLAPACRFVPNCSQYGIDAIGRHGVVRGVGLAVRRLGKCHPLHEGGFDPVP